MVTPGNREGRERERQTERRRKKREYFAMREERRRFPEAMYERVFALAVRSIAKIAPNLGEACTNLGRSERGREKRREEGCGERRKMAMKGGGGGSSLRAKTRSIDRLSIDDPTIQEEFVTFDGDCLPKERHDLWNKRLGQPERRRRRNPSAVLHG